jgi:hypothetical protein
MSGVMESCPHCKSAYGAWILGIRSGLGSSTYICKSCRKPFLSGRHEWTELTAFGKLWYCLVSVAYVGFLGFVGGLVCKSVVQFLEEGPKADKVKPEGMLYWCGFISLASLVAFLQGMRVVWSLKRTSGLEKVIQRVSFCSLQTNLQMLSLLTLMSIVLAAWTVSWLIH